MISYELARNNLFKLLPQKVSLALGDQVSLFLPYKFDDGICECGFTYRKLSFPSEISQPLTVFIYPGRDQIEIIADFRDEELIMTPFTIPPFSPVLYKELIDSLDQLFPYSFQSLLSPDVELLKKRIHQILIQTLSKEEFVNYEAVFGEWLFWLLDDQ